MIQKIFPYFANFQQTPSFCGKVNATFFNDVHGNMDNLDSYVTARDEFYSKHKGEANLTLCGGDIFIDNSIQNPLIARAMSPLLDAVSVGNHDAEGGTKYFNQLIKMGKMGKKWLGANIFFKNKTRLEDSIQKSIIVEKEGEKIGVLGVAPFDFKNVILKSKSNEMIKIEDFDKTKKILEKEIETLEKQGVDKIVLLAHTGIKSPEGVDYYKEFADIGGIDVIIGGHDHKQVFEWATSKRDEPVLVVSTGAREGEKFKGNLDTFGELELSFDDDGVLIQDECNVEFKKSEEYPRTRYVDGFKMETDMKVLRELEGPVVAHNALTHESKVGNIVTDAFLWYVNRHAAGERAECALLNSTSIRGSFENANVLPEDVVRVLPFASKNLYKAELTKKELIQALEAGVRSTTYERVAPGLLQVSGIKYTINPDNTVSNVRIMKKDGTVKYNLDDCPDDKKIMCVYDTFLASGTEVPSLKRNIKKDGLVINCSTQRALLEYMGKNNSLWDYKPQRISESA